MSDIDRHQPTADVVRRRRGMPSVPIGYRPAPSDDELETNILERWQGWGVLLTLFLGLFLPVYMLFFEPARATEKALEFREAAIKRGADIFQAPPPNAHGFNANCARCHGTLAGGGVVPNFRSSAGAAPVDYKAPGLRDVFKRQMVDQKKTPKAAYQFVYDTIAEGRPGTPMPTWGLGYGGPMNDQQIEDVITFLISIQEGLPEGTKLAFAEQRGPFSRLIAFAAERR